jgi:hypothetical protein
VAPGDLVVVPTQPALGVGRLERLLPQGEEPTHARLLLYDDGRLVVVELTDVAPAPPGPWDKGASPGSSG